MFKSIKNFEAFCYFNREFSTINVNIYALKDQTVKPNMLNTLIILG